MTDTPQTVRQTPEEIMKRALLEIKSLKNKVSQLEGNAREPIAIVGMSCRLPGGVYSPEQFWQLLVSGKDCLTKIPEKRWKNDSYFSDDRGAKGKTYTEFGYFLEDVSGFDADFFGISPREANTLDPQQRLLLELAWEAFEDSGIPLPRIQGSRTGVYLGVMNQDYFQLSAYPLDAIAQHTATGYTLSVASGRISHFFGLTGPALTIDTACSSSLVALHTAMLALRAREVDAALVCGVNLILSPRTTILECKAGMLSPDGRSKAFDDSADGYGRGEGGGAIVVKRLSDAVRNGDRILAVLRGAAVNHDGRSSGLTAPNGSAQQAVLRAALESAQVSPSDVFYVEAHGTGTSLGDPIEVDALRSVYGGVDRNSPLLIGSVKTNVGHLEGAAGITSIIKAVLCLRNRAIPGQLHFNVPNHHIEWSNLGISVVTRQTPIASDSQKVKLGVSAFGLSGTNAHVILEEYVGEKSVMKTKDEDVNLLLLSASNTKALRDVASRYSEVLEKCSDAQFLDVCRLAATSRTHLGHRLALYGVERSEALSLLREIKAGLEPSNSDHVSMKGILQKPKRAFVFTGQGSQYIGMGRRLYENHSRFRELIDAADRVLFECDEIDVKVSSIRDLMFGVIGTEQQLHDTACAQPAIYMLEFGLATILLEAGVQPQAVIGHSVGEYVAATIAGVWSWQDGLKFIARRASAMGRLPMGGAMIAAIGDSEATIEVAKKFPKVSLAVQNSSTNTVFAGSQDDLSELQKRLADQGFATKSLIVSHAFHSALMEPALVAIEDAARSVTMNKPRLPFVSNLTGEISTEQFLKPEYWSQHTRNTVKFADGIRSLSDFGITTFIEIGATPALAALSKAEPHARWITSLSPKRDDLESLARLFGELFTDGCELDWKSVFGNEARSEVSLPNYPFQREVYWVEKKTSSTGEDDSGRGYGITGVAVPLPYSSERRTMHSASIADEWLLDHRVFNQPVLPAALYLSYISQIVSVNRQGFELSDVTFSKAVVVPENGGAVDLQTIVSGDGVCRVVACALDAQFVEVACAKLNSLSTKVSEIPSDYRTTTSIESARFYRGMTEQGYGVERSFARLEHFGVADSFARATFTLTGQQAHGLLLSPEIIDSTFHLLLAASGIYSRPYDGSVFVPYSIESITVCSIPQSGEFTLTARHHRDDSETRIRGDLTICAGELPYLIIRGFEARLVSRAALFGEVQGRLPPIHHAVWQKIETEQVGHELTVAFIDLGSENQQSIKSVWEESLPALSILDEAPANSVTDALIFILKGAARADDIDASRKSYERAYSKILQTIQELTASPVEVLPRIVVVASGSLTVHEGEVVTSPLSAGLLGLLRVAKREESRFHYTFIDCNVSVDERYAAIAVGNLIGNDRQSYEYALRIVDGEVSVFVEKDRELTIPEAKAPTLLCDPAGLYLVTGGLGSLGVKTAEWLVECGARRIALISRDTSKFGQLPQLQGLRERGIDLQVVQCDISLDSSAEDLRRSLSQTCNLSDAEKVRVAGVIHSAGVLHDAGILDQSWALAEKCLAPKVFGLHSVMSAVDFEPTAFVVCYSSASGVLGNAGQANYAAANTALDAYVAKLRSQGVRAFSIQWGPIAEAGMAGRDDLTQRFERFGITPLNVTTVFKVLGTLLNDAPSSALVVDINWETFGKQSGELPARLAELATLVGRTSCNFTDLVSGKDIKLKKKALKELVAAETAAILGRKTLQGSQFDQGFFDLGMDSMMTVELKNALSQAFGVSLPATVVLEHPSVNDLTEFLIADTLAQHFVDERVVVKEELVDRTDLGSNVSSLDDELLRLEALLGMK